MELLRSCGVLCFQKYVCLILIFQKNEARLVGVPAAMRHGLLSLPHSFSPRFHVGIHLRLHFDLCTTMLLISNDGIRCQFKSFEQLIGPDDGEAWLRAVKERDDFLNSTGQLRSEKSWQRYLISDIFDVSDPNKGIGLFKIIEAKLVEDLAFIKKSAARQVIHDRRRLEQGQRRLQLTFSHRSSEGDASALVSPSSTPASSATTQTTTTMTKATTTATTPDTTAGKSVSEPELPKLVDEEILKESYDVAARSKIHVFISSDNEEGE